MGHCNALAECCDGFIQLVGNGHIHSAAGPGAEAPARRLATTAVTVAAGYTSSLIFANLASPMSLSFHPADGRVFVCLKAGVVMVGGGAAETQLTPFLSMAPASVSTIGDGGLLQATLDPFDPAHAFIYVQYVVPSVNGAGQGDHSRVSRFSVNAAGTSASAASEQVLFEHSVLPSGTAIQRVQ